MLAWAVVLALGRLVPTPTLRNIVTWTIAVGGVAGMGVLGDPGDRDAVRRSVMSVLT